MTAFIDRLAPVSLNSGFRQDGYWVWCGSVMRDDAGRYQLFASRWPARFPMHPGWTYHSEIVRAVADYAEGPYVFQEVVLPRRDPTFWDGRMTHNPAIRRHGKQWLLFYTGVTYPEAPPLAENHPTAQCEDYRRVWNTKRIGLAVADQPEGPWRRADAPILEARAGHWDESITSNPAPWVHADGSVDLIYKSAALSSGAFGGPFRLGLARASHWQGSFARVVDHPVLDFGERGHVEDPFLWHDAEGYHCLMKDMTGSLCGEKHAGILAHSADAVHWQLAEQPKAYSRHVHLLDGGTVTLGSFERPHLLFDEQGKPSHLFAAVADGPGTFERAATTWNLVTPLH